MSTRPTIPYLIFADLPQFVSIFFQLARNVILYVNCVTYHLYFFQMCQQFYFVISDEDVGLCRDDIHSVPLICWTDKRHKPILDFVYY